MACAKDRNWVERYILHHWVFSVVLYFEGIYLVVINQSYVVMAVGSFYIIMGLVLFLQDLIYHYLYFRKTGMYQTPKLTAGETLLDQTGLGMFIVTTLYFIYFCYNPSFYDIALATLIMASHFAIWILGFAYYKIYKNLRQPELNNGKQQRED